MLNLIIEKAKKLWVSLSIPVLILLLIVLWGIPILPESLHPKFFEEPKVQSTLLFMFLGMILWLVIDIRDRVREKIPPKRYLDLNEAWKNEIEHEIMVRLKGKGAEISWLGVTLNDAWPTRLGMLLRKIVDNKEYSKNITVRLSQVDPEYLKKISSSLPRDYVDEAGDAWRQIHSFIDRISKIEGCKLTVKVDRYSYMPNFHGVLIGNKEGLFDNKALFLSRVRFDENSKIVSSEEEPYERFEMTTVPARYEIKMFQRWFQMSTTYKCPAIRGVTDKGTSLTE